MRSLHLAYCLIAAATPLAAQQATVANAQEQAIAPDSVARRLLAELDPAIRQEVRYHGSNNFTGEPLPGYGRPLVLLRREAAEALARVQRRLEARGLGLKVWDGYRPVRGTLAMVAWTERVGRTELLDDGYIARRSRHNQGVAVDLTVIDLATGAELDMGGAFDEFSELSHTANATGVVAVNRAILGEAMAAEGFVNYVNEWWHFSFAVPDPVPFDLLLEHWGL
ncbi:MAG: M15 family metallopeptidase [Gemmatimonadales bacterium]|nr:M15 family metallopeptidase [Gemmatimonadales bacterium]